MDNDDFCSYEQAVLLRKLGFDRVCSVFWRTSFCIDGKPNRNRKTKHLPNISMAPASNSELESLNENLITAPTLAKAQKWLREEKGIAINVIAHDGGLYQWEDVYLPNAPEYDGCVSPDIKQYATYESALSAGIDAALKLIDDSEK